MVIYIAILFSSGKSWQQYSQLKMQQGKLSRLACGVSSKEYRKKPLQI